MIEHIRSDNLLEDTLIVYKAFMETLLGTDCIFSLFQSVNKNNAQLVKPEIVAYSPVFGERIESAGANVKSDRYSQVQEIVISHNLISGSRADSINTVIDGVMSLRILDTINRVFNALQPGAIEYYKTLPFNVTIGGTTFTGTSLKDMGVDAIFYSDMQPLDPFNLQDQVTFFTTSLFVNRIEDAFRLE